MKREREIDTSGKIRKIRQSEELGIFSYNIPVEIKSSFFRKVRASNSFIPTYQESHIGIAYFQYNDPKEKEKNTKRLLALIPKIELIEFKPEITQIKKAISKLETISKMMNEIYTHIGANSIVKMNKNERESYAEIHLKPVKALALEVLAINYIHFEEAFAFLNHSMQDTETPSINSYSHLEWTVIFYWCWFVAFKISRENISRYHLFFFRFPADSIKILFKSLNRATHVIKYLVFDIFCQYFYHERAFNNENDVLRSILTILHSNSTKLTTPVYMFVDKFKAIMNSEIIRACLKVSKKTLKAVVKEFINNTYLVDLPESIIGLTLCNRIVVIKELSFMNSDFENENTIIGLILMTMLHELGYFMQRFDLTNYYAWFEKASPLYDGKSDAGSALINKIFNCEPKYINIEATRFLLELSNWDLPHETFISQFKKKNTFSKIRERMLSPLQRRLKQIDDEPGTRSLIGCSRWPGKIIKS